MEPTSEPDVQMEEIRPGLVRYFRDDGTSWEISGICDHRANCLVGAVIDGELIETIERARELADAYTGPDVPVTPDFRGCCPLTGKWLDGH